MSRVSVVIPALNDSVMLASCLRALAKQTRLPDEIIVVDNGSTDDTAA
ncbi:MAG: glycosyltransferase, partial [Rhodoglobus sp.]